MYADIDFSCVRRRVLRRRSNANLRVVHYVAVGHKRFRVKFLRQLTRAEGNVCVNLIDLFDATDYPYGWMEMRYGAMEDA